ncbi:DUF6844 domain-containing protein [Shewanella baltica]|uniref:DUF6844 domain-containing protein n=1 Tax=Shewanella baltica TaxID=62322 RepID=UPI00014F89E5|nr:hypothetical protein [Shewanella baltica]ABS07672.1 putative periplasmic protein [Shewanella baltica OS185]
MKLTNIALAFATIFITLHPFTSHASEETAVNVEAYDKDVEPFKSVGSVLDEQISAYFRSIKASPGLPSATGKTYYSATQTVSVSPESPDFPKALQIAFDKAFNNARAEFIFDRFGRETSKTYAELYENGNSDRDTFNPEMCEKSKLESIYDKIIALAESELDKALEDNGVDPVAFKSTPETARKDLFIDKSIETISRRANGEIVGILPVKSFYAIDTKGTPKVGVVMVHAPELVDVANDIRLGKTPSLRGKKPGKPVSTYVNLPESELIANFGPRLVFDEQNRPVILAYAQWNSAYQGNDSRQSERSRDAAFKKADMQASQLITEFLSGKLSQQSELIAGEYIHRYIETDCKNQTEQEKSTLIDEYASKLKITASAKVSGSTVIKKWSLMNKYGGETIGVIRAWTPELSDLIQESSTKQHKSKVNSSSGDLDPEESW